MTPGSMTLITRKHSRGEPILYAVPKMIEYHNKCMPAVNVFDQVLKMFCVDFTHRTLKYTARSL